MIIVLIDQYIKRITEMKKLGIIGCGQIATHHLETLRFVGFEIEYVASSKGSKTISLFAKKNAIKNYLLILMN